MIYLAFILALTLACVGAVGFFYMLFLERMTRQQNRRIAELEREREELLRRLWEAEEMLSQVAVEDEDEAWPEVVEGDD